MGPAADEESAHSSPVLIVYDGDMDAIYAVAVSEKSPRPWLVEYVHQVINELGYGGIKIAVKCDKAPDLQLLRRQVSARRSAATVPIDVETRESKGNGAVKQAVRTWQGQFRTLKC